MDRGWFWSAWNEGLVISLLSSYITLRSYNSSSKWRTYELLTWCYSAGVLVCWLKCGQSLAASSESCLAFVSVGLNFNNNHDGGENSSHAHTSTMDTEMSEPSGITMPHAMPVSRLSVTPSYFTSLTHTLSRHPHPMRQLREATRLTTHRRHP
jgi:hypothetical protein